MNLADRILHLCHSLGSNSVIIADSSFRESIHLSNTTSSDSSHVPLLDIATTLRIIQKSPKDCVHLLRKCSKVFFACAEPSHISNIQEIIVGIKSHSLSIDFELVSSLSHEQLVNELDDIGKWERFLGLFLSISCYPLHALTILKRREQSNDGVELLYLASHHCRKIAPLSLRKLKLHYSHRSVNDVLAADLPQDIKKDLKLLAHEIAGALVFELSLDPSNSIFAMGKTSSLVGHSLLPITESFVALRNSGESTSKDGVKYYFPPHDGKLPSAALIIIDRSEDLFTPLSCSGSHPLAHRILNTLKCYQYSETVEQWNHGARNNYDISVKQLSHISAAESIASTRKILSASEKFPLLSPMSGVFNASFPISPSLRYSCEKDLFFQRAAKSEDLRKLLSKDGFSIDDHMSDRTLLEVLTGSEDAGRNSLVRNLKVRIAAEKGEPPPPKKRGLGAEVLALVQALAVSPGERGNDGHAPESQKGSSSLSAYSPRTCIQSQGMLALALAVVESMQRSSSKQFHSVCSWQCCYDTRATREMDMQQRIQSRSCDLDVCLSLLQSQLSAKILSQQKDVPVRGAEKEKAADSNVVDLIHTLTQIIRLAFLFRFNNSNHRSSLDRIEECIIDYILHKSVDEEISYLVDIQFLSLQTMSDVSTYRHISEEAERSIQQQIDSSCNTDSTFVDWNSEWEDVEEDTNASPSPSSSSRLNSLIADKMEANEKLISIFRSNVEDNIRQSISAIHELVARWESNQSTAKGWDMLSKLENIFPGTNKNKSQNTDEPYGIVATMVEEFLSKRSHGLADTLLLDELQYIESPLQQMKRAGLGLLSHGLGRLGFSNPVASAAPKPNPTMQPTLVLFLLGGLTFKEVGQVRAVIKEDAAQRSDGSRIILMTTGMSNNENILFDIFDS